MSVIERLKNAVERIERRRHLRTGSPVLTVNVDGRKYRAMDWSLGGCRIQASSTFQLKQQVRGRVRLAGADGRGEFVAEVVRVEADGQVALRWLELSPHVFVAMGQSR